MHTSTQTSTVSHLKKPDVDQNRQCHSKVLCKWKLMFKLPGSDCRKGDDKGISKIACNWTKACSRRSSHSWLTLPLLLNSGFPWIHALLPCQKVLWLEPLFLLKELGTDRGRFYSVPGCGDTNSDTSFTPAHLRLWLMLIRLLAGHTASVTTGIKQCWWQRPLCGTQDNLPSQQQDQWSVKRQREIK